MQRGNGSTAQRSAFEYAQPPALQLTPIRAFHCTRPSEAACACSETTARLLIGLLSLILSIGAKADADQRITLHVSVCYFAQQRRTRDGRGDGTLT